MVSQSRACWLGLFDEGQPGPALPLLLDVDSGGRFATSRCLAESIAHSLRIRLAPILGLAELIIGINLIPLVVAVSGCGIELQLL